MRFASGVSFTMVEELLPDLYRVEIPLPGSPLKALNSYIVKGRERFLIIDTGLNREECLRPMLSALKKLEVDLNRTDFFITHLHADHSGLVGALVTDTSKVYFNRPEASSVAFQISEDFWKGLFAFYHSNGFPEDEIKKVREGHPGYRYSIRNQINLTVTDEGDEIEVGDYLFRCIETPGHSPGHTCLYEASKKVLVCGDHILFDITPNITYWGQLKNSLKQYLTNLEKVYTLDVNLVLPGHRNLWNNHRKRIMELQEHHRNRLDEVLFALEDSEKTAWEVAPYITWDIGCNSWEEFPSVQKWFAVGETIAHLDYLEADGRARKETKNHKVLYSLS
ncbi:MAG: MBL fold metallo-hydrolase [Dehalococcoidia bacterium]|nr:MBL fold metallo-hydrolase [Dehalococcoidia bacterium]